MALGAMAKYPSTVVKIVPVGLWYFHPHKFRSRACIEFGRPLIPTPEQVAAYAQGGEAKRTACAGLLQHVYEALCTVTVQAPNYDALQVIQATRRLYRPNDQKLSIPQQVLLSRRFAQVQTDH